MPQQCQELTSSAVLIRRPDSSSSAFAARSIKFPCYPEKIPCYCSEPLGLNRELCLGFASLMGVLILELDGTPIAEG